MPRVRIQGSEQPLEKVFGSDFSFAIPLYQRPYSWETEHAEAMLEDLLTAAGPEGVPVDRQNPYFFGSIVLVKQEHLPRAEVVDGQQRLTTLTILLSVLRHALPPEYAAALTPHLYEQGNPITGTPHRFRLTLRERDRAFFEDLIQQEGGLARLPEARTKRLSDSQQNIRDNAALLLEKVQRLPVGQRLRLARYLHQQCYLVVVSTPDFDSAYRIFSVLNDRGLDLSHADILKAEIIGAVGDHEQDAYGKKWEDVEESLGQDSFQELFAHIRMVHRKAKPRDSVLAEIRQHVQPARRPKAFIDRTLVPFAEALLGLKRGFSGADGELRRLDEAVRWLNHLDNVDWVPPAIQYLTRTPLDADQTLPFVRDLDRLAWSMFIRRANINERIDRYGQVLAHVEAGADPFAPTSPLQLTMEEASETLRRLDGNLYEAPRIRTQVLLRLDAMLSGGEAKYEFGSVTVEHVLPQNPAPAGPWMGAFPDPLEREALVHRIGNLLLLSKAKNAQAQNYAFSVKKERYFAGRGGVSPFVLTTQVLRESEWTPAVIRRRQAELLGVLKRTWRL